MQPQIYNEPQHYVPNLYGEPQYQGIIPYNQHKYYDGNQFGGGRE